MKEAAHRSYFKNKKGQPPPLKAVVEREVRFEEVDVMGIVWHGRYPSYFEDGRVALGEKFGIDYMDFYRNGVFAPIKKLHIDHLIPLEFRERISIKTILHWSDAARLNHEFIIYNRLNQVSATGYTVQMLLDKNGNILFVPPPFYEAFQAKWRAGEFH